MKAPKEIELKLALPAEGMRRIESSPLMRGKRRAAKARELISVYFDTESRKLRRHGISLRVRHDGKSRRQTVKANGAGGGLFVRDEWEHAIAGDTPDLKAARKSALGSFSGKKLRHALKPVFETRVRRTVVPVRRRKSEIELTLDRGTVRSDGRTAEICEVELELKRGERAALFDLAREVAKLAPVSLAVSSKSDRGYALADREAVGAVKAPDVAIAHGASTGDAFCAIASSCLRHLAANEAAVRLQDPEGVHQMRVGLRRLRAATSLFGELVAGPQTEAIKKELKWLTGKLALARDLDVFVSDSVTPLRQAQPAKPGAVALQADVEQRRAQAFGRAEAAVESRRYRVLVLDTLAWLEAGDWTRSDDPLVRALRRRPVAAFAAEELKQRRKKVLKKSKKLESLAPARRHKLRIAVKKLRYATDFFAGVFPGRKGGKRRKRFERHLGACKMAWAPSTTSRCMRSWRRTSPMKGQDFDQAPAAAPLLPASSLGRTKPGSGHC